MANAPDDFEDIVGNVVPEIEPAPIVTRKLIPAPWHRPRKQYVRINQWAKEILAHIVKKSSRDKSESVIRVFGLPSSEYLDLLSMRKFCEQHALKIQYFGFNASYKPATGEPLRKRVQIDLHAELQSQRMISASSFVHPTSVLYPDRFELLRNPQSQSRVVLNQFKDFDVINLDICGCIVDPNKNRATHVLEAISELLNWQAVRRLKPWLFFVTTHSSPQNVNREGCQCLIEAIKDNADASPTFRDAFTKKAEVAPDDFMAVFANPDADLPKASKFMSIFSVALGKWVAGRVRQATPPALVSMLPSFCFRHSDDNKSSTLEEEQDPELLSLAYLIEPSPVPAPSGISVKPAILPDLAAKYDKRAAQILNKSFQMIDLDILMRDDAVTRGNMAKETKQLLVGCGFDEADVDEYLRPWS